MIKLTPRAILAAVGETLAEQQTEQNRTNAELRAELAALRRQIEALESREPAKHLRAVMPS